MVGIDPDVIKNEITEILISTFDEMKILIYLPMIAFADEPYFLVKGIKNGELILLKYKLADLLRLREECKLCDVLLKDRYSV